MKKKNISGFLCLQVKNNLAVLFLISLLTAGVLNAQSFNASVNNTTVSTNSPFEVAFQFQGDEINSVQNFRAPDFKGFQVLSGPNQATSMQIINGAVSASITFSYYVQVTQPGTLTIGSASVDHKTKTYKTQPIKITVVQGAANPGGQQQQGKSGAPNVNIADNVFIRAVADRQKVLKGEQVTVTYKLYTRMDISSPQISKLPSYQGFWAEELETASRITFSTEVIDGKQFRVGVLKKAALFPTQTGTLSVTPFELLIPVMVPKQRRRGDIFDEFFNDPFFNQAQTVEYKATSNVLKINVLPLPSENVPASFTGAVGNFSLNATLDRNTVKQNEPVTLKYVISGTGNIKLTDLPELKLPAGFEKYDAKISEQISRSGRISGQKTIEYLVVPRIQGEKEIPAIEFSYYNPSSNKYVTLTSPSFKLNIEKGSGRNDESIAGFSKEDVKLLGQDIRFIKTTGSLSRKDVYVIYQPLFWVMSLLPLLALAGIIVWKKREEKLSGNVQLMKFHRAEKLALNRLKTAKKSLDQNNQKEFYSDISLALFGYLEDKLHIEKSEFTLDRAITEMRRRNIPEELITEVQKTIEQCEFARFAPSGSAGSAMKDMYDKSVQIIISIEKSLLNPKHSLKKETTA